jgi:hypothetical protein
MHYRKMTKQSGKTVSINWINDTEKYIIVPRREKNRIVKKLKRLIKVKGSCYFTQGVPHKLIDFIYRAVIQLGLRDRKLIFSRGSVKNKYGPTRSAVEICELDWDLGTSFIIPMKRNYGAAVNLVIDDKKHSVRFMEIMVLSGLLRLKYPGKSGKWRSAMAAAIVTQGWGMLARTDPPKVYLSNE